MKKKTISVASGYELVSPPSQGGGLGVAEGYEIVGLMPPEATQAEPPVEQPQNREGWLDDLMRGFRTELTMGYLVPEEVKEAPPPETIPEKVAYGAGSLVGMIPSFAATGLLMTPITSAALKAGRVARLMSTIGRISPTAEKMAVGGIHAGATFGAHGAIRKPETEEEDNLIGRLKAGAKEVPTGVAFGVAGGLPVGKLAHAAIAGGIGAGAAAIEGGSTEDVLIQGGLLSALSLIHGVTGETARRMIKGIANRIDQLPPDDRGRAINETIEAARGDLDDLADFLSDSINRNEFGIDTSGFRYDVYRDREGLERIEEEEAAHADARKKDALKKLQDRLAQQEADDYFEQEKQNFLTIKQNLERFQNGDDTALGDIDEQYAREYVLFWEDAIERADRKRAFFAQRQAEQMARSALPAPEERKALPVAKGYELIEGPEERRLLTYSPREEAEGGSIPRDLRQDEEIEGETIYPTDLPKGSQSGAFYERIVAESAKKRAQREQEIKMQEEWLRKNKATVLPPETEEMGRAKEKLDDLADAWNIDIDRDVFTERPAMGGESGQMGGGERLPASKVIDIALEKGRITPGTARLAKHLLSLDPTFDENSTLEIVDAVREATSDIIAREGGDPSRKHRVTGQTVTRLEGDVLKTAISLYRGHDADTLVEEWYHRYYQRMSARDREAFEAYHRRTRDPRPADEHFAQEGRDFFFSEGYHEPAGKIQELFDRARESLKALVDRIWKLRDSNIPQKIQRLYRKAGGRVKPKRKASRLLVDRDSYEPEPGDSGVIETAYQIRLFAEDKDVDCKPITEALLRGDKIRTHEMAAWQKAAKAAGVSPEGIAKATRTFRLYNEMKDVGPVMWLPERTETERSVVLREGVLNTPAVEGVRRERLDRLYEDIKMGKRSSMRGATPQPFLNVPITQPRLQKAPPTGHRYPLVVTGNPHIDNFRRPHKGWDKHIKAVRVKPVLGGNEKVNRAVIDAIEYAKEIGARVLITTFRAKQPWVLAKYTKFLPTDPSHPDFDTYWKENPNPKPTDPRRLPDWTPYVPRDQKVSEVFRANGWDTERNIYGSGGTWWWPRSRQLDPEIIDAVGKDVELEYCDLLHKGCPSCRNCQKLTYPESAGSPIIGVTDEPFCEHGCPQCFVRLGQSGVAGRKGISIGRNAKQAGFGEPDMGDIYSQTVNIIHSLARKGRYPKLDYISSFLRGTPAEKMDMAMSLFLDGDITPEQFNTIRGEIGREVGGIADQVLPPETAPAKLGVSERVYNPREREYNNPPYEVRDDGEEGNARNSELRAQVEEDLRKETEVSSIRGEDYYAGRQGPGGSITRGLGIKEELIQKGRVDLRGHKVRNAHDVAELCQVFRDPRIETLRFIYVKGNRIVAHEGVTSRMPGTTLFSRNTEKTIRQMEDRMRRLGATGYYILHNHPSGNVNPSVSDMALTRGISAYLRGCKGHIIINHDKYCVIPPGGKSIFSSELEPKIFTIEKKAGTPDPLLQPSIPHKLLGEVITGPEDIFAIGKNLETPDNYVTLLYCSADGRVRAIQDVPVKLFERPNEMADVLRGRKRAFGAVAAMAFSNKPSESMIESAKTLISNTGLDDAVFAGKSYYEEADKMGVRSTTARRLANTMEIYKVSEEGAERGISRVREQEEEPPLPKYANSVNLDRQILSDAMKHLEVEVSKEIPKSHTTHDEIMRKAKRILGDHDSMVEVLMKAKHRKGLTTEEHMAVRAVNATFLDKLKGIFERKDLSPEELDRKINEYRNDIFEAVDNAANMAGTTLNAYRIMMGPQEKMAKALAKLQRGLNEREFEEFQKVVKDGYNPLAVERFLKRLGDPTLADYFFEFFYNNILSGIPTHLVNFASNTVWNAFQLGHRALTGGIDWLMSRFTGREREIFMSEVLPMIAGYKRGEVKGRTAAKEFLKTGNIVDFVTKWNEDIGADVIGAFSRSPNPLVRKIAPFISAPTRALMAADIWAKCAAYDAEISAIARRRGLQKGLKGDALKKFEEEQLKNAVNDPEMMEAARKFSDYATFTDEPGDFTKWIISGRERVPALRLIIPFVRTVGNLIKRGIEMVPGAGIAVAKGQPTAEVIAKQVEGAVLALIGLYLCDQDRITGEAPTNATERERFYAQGKLPWAIKIGDKWVQYKRLEPFSTAIATMAIAYDKIVHAKDDETAQEAFGNAVNGMVNYLLDSSYLSGVSSVLDRYGGHKGWIQRTAAGALVPYSSFWRSINHSIEVAVEGDAKLRDSVSWLGAFGQVIPGLSTKVPPKLNVWGEPVTLEGGVFRQWLPYKYATETNDKVEKVLAEIERYPALPRQTIKVGKEEVRLPDDFYRDYCIHFGHRAKEALDRVVSRPIFDRLSTERKAEVIERTLYKIRSLERKRAIREYKKMARE